MIHLKQMLKTHEIVISLVAKMAILCYIHMHVCLHGACHLGSLYYACISWLNLYFMYQMHVHLVHFAE